LFAGGSRSKYFDDQVIIDRSKDVKHVLPCHGHAASLTIETNWRPRLETAIAIDGSFVWQAKPLGTLRTLRQQKTAGAQGIRSGSGRTDRPGTLELPARRCTRTAP